MEGLTDYITESTWEEVLTVTFIGRFHVAIAPIHCNATCGWYRQ